MNKTNTTDNVLPKTPGEDKEDISMPKLKPKTKALVHLLHDDPTLSQAQAYRQLHPNASQKTSEVESSKTLSKPSVQVYKKKYVREAKKTVAMIMFESRRQLDKPAFARLAKDAADSILDRELGKATIKTESNNTNLNLNIEASQELNQGFTDYLKSQTEQ